MTTKEIVEWLELKQVAWALAIYAVTLTAYWTLVE